MDEDSRPKMTRGRLDFIITIDSFDPETGHLSFALKPNPERYDWVEHEGKKWLFDKLDRIMYPPDLLERLTENMDALPIYFEAPLITDSKAYVESRKEAITSRLKGAPQTETLEDKSLDFLEGLAANRLGFAILSVDLVGSTRIVRSISPQQYEILISILLEELAHIVPLFRGHVLKFTGDGLIAYFPEPSFMLKTDLAMQAAMTFQLLVNKTLNPLFETHELPSIQIRVGLELGDAAILTIGSPSTKQHKDIIGEVVNLAAKIQSIAPRGGIVLGEMAARNLHTQYRKYCELHPVPPNWPYTHSDGRPYGVYRLKGWGE